MRSEATPLREISFSASRTQIRIHTDMPLVWQLPNPPHVRQNAPLSGLCWSLSASARASEFYYADTIQMMDYNNNNTQIVFCYNNNFILKDHLMCPILVGAAREREVVGVLLNLKFINSSRLLPLCAPSGQIGATFNPRPEIRALHKNARRLIPTTQCAVRNLKSLYKYLYNNHFWNRRLFFNSAKLNLLKADPYSSFDL